MKKGTRVLAVFVAWILFVINVGQDIAFAQVNSAAVEAQNNEEEKNMPFQEQMKNVDVNFRVVTEWEGGYQGEITLTNKGSEVVDGWRIDFVTNDTITNMWNCSVLQNDEMGCSIAAMEYNTVIKPNESVSIGYCANGNRYTFSKIEILIEDNEDALVDNLSGKKYVYEYDLFTVEYCIQSAWNGNYNAIMKIINTSKEDIENWQISWKTDDVISDVYNAKVICEDNVYTLKNVE